MAIETYGELKTEIANWLDREDQTANIPNFVRLAEADIYRDLRSRQNEFVALYTKTDWFINGVSQGAVPDGNFLLLPPNYKEMKLVTFDGIPLQEISEQRIRDRIRNFDDQLVLYYAEYARQVIFSNSIPTTSSEWGDDQELNYTYYGVESLDSFPSWQTKQNPVENPPVEDTTPEGITQSDGNTTRMLQHAPDLYLSGSMVWALRFLYPREPERWNMWKTIFEEAKIRLDTESQELTGSSVSVASVYSDGERTGYAY